MDDKNITPELVKQFFHSADVYAEIRKQLDSTPATPAEAYFAGAMYGYLEKCKEIIEEEITINID